MAEEVSGSSEPVEEVPENPTATVDEFEIEEGNPSGFPSKAKRLKPDKPDKPDKEVKSNGNESKDPSPGRRS